MHICVAKGVSICSEREAGAVDWPGGGGGCRGGERRRRGRRRSGGAGWRFGRIGAGASCGDEAPAAMGEVETAVADPVE